MVMMIFVVMLATVRMIVGIDEDLDCDFDDHGDDVITAMMMLIMMMTTPVMMTL